MIQYHDDPVPPLGLNWKVRMRRGPRIDLVQICRNRNDANELLFLLPFYIVHMPEQYGDVTSATVELSATEATIGMN